MGRRKGLAGVPGAGTLSVALSASSHRGPVHTLDGMRGAWHGAEEHGRTW